MENDYENDIWESFLRIAVIKNSIDEIDDYPFEEIKKIQLPQHYDTKMRRLAKRLHYQEMTKHALKYGKKIVAVAILNSLVFALKSATTLLCVFSGTIRFASSAFSISSS